MAVFRIRGLRMAALWVSALGASALCTLLGSGVVLAAQPAAPALQTQSMQTQSMQTIGRAATPAEIAAWDIDVRADFKGLPRGRGSVSQGETLWEGKCASCHGSFGEANHVFPPIAGGTTAKDIASGRVAALTRPEARSTLMKLSRLSTLWDYIHRAMPWNAPRTLSADEVYAVTAYILNLGDIVPGDFVLSHDNIAQVQQRLPNRNGLTTAHGLWEVRGKPDVRNTACMKDCPVQFAGVGGTAGTPGVASALPESYRGSHGNLAEQHRLIGPVRGVGAQAAAASAAAPATASATASATTPATTPAAPQALATRHACLSCHAPQGKLLGPSIQDIAGKYRGEAGAEAKLLAKLKAGGAGVWGAIPMPAQSHVKEDELRSILNWMLGGG
jgi:cytochrome c